jgi:hypothetical protein
MVEQAFLLVFFCWSFIACSVDLAEGIVVFIKITNCGVETCNDGWRLADKTGRTR